MQFLPEMISGAGDYMNAKPEHMQGFDQNTGSHYGSQGGGGQGGGGQGGGGMGGGGLGGMMGGMGGGGGGGGMSGLMSGASNSPGGHAWNQRVGGDLINYWLTKKMDPNAPYAAGEAAIAGIPTDVHKYLDPVYKGYSESYQHPGAVMSQIGSHFQTSPGYSFERSQALNAANSAAAIGGMSGTPEAQQSAAKAASNVADMQYNNYMNRGLGLRQSGLAGAGHTGSQEISDLSAYMEMMAKMRSGSAEAEQQKKGRMGGFMGDIGSSFL